jgi:putative ABC transport system substrate-binding protein
MPTRREILVLGGALALPQARLASAQPAKTHRIVWLSVLTRDGSATFMESFLQGMAAHGYAAGRNLVVDARFGDNSRETLDRLALEAAALKPAVIVTQGPALHAARKTPGGIPVVFGFSGDPVEAGVAQSLGRPGGRFMGVSFLAYELSAKRVELMREVLPRMKRIGVLSNPHHIGDSKEFEATRTAAARFGLEVTHHPGGDPKALERALAAIAAARVDALVIHPDGFMVQQREAIARFSVQNRIPGISGWAAIAEGGSLMTYGPSLQEAFRRLAYFVDRILRGANPADLPIELPSKLEMVVNLKAAKALGVTVPRSVMLRADRVIE